MCVCSLHYLIFTVCLYHPLLLTLRLRLSRLLSAQLFLFSLFLALVSHLILRRKFVRMYVSVCVCVCMCVVANIWKQYGIRQCLYNQIISLPRVTNEQNHSFFFVSSTFTTVVIMTWVLIGCHATIKMFVIMFLTATCVSIRIWDYFFVTILCSFGD